MNPDLIAAAVVCGPAAVAGLALAVTWWRHSGEYSTALAILAEHRAAAAACGPDGPPPDGGMPTAAPPGDIADVIPLPVYRAA